MVGRTDGLKQGGLAQGITKLPFPNGQFQSGGTAIMAVYEVSCILIARGKEFSNLVRWSWRIITAYCPILSASAGGAYIQQLEALAIIEIQNDSRTQCWIYLNT